VVGHRFGGVTLFVLGFLLFSTISRIGLTAKAAAVVSWDPTLPAAYGLGFFFDLLTAGLCGIPLVLWLMLLPQSLFVHPVHRAGVRFLTMLALFAGCFVTAAEWVFWHELDARFNFVSVDYLIYTYEVVGNIWQSYPMPVILCGLAITTTVLYLVLRQTRSLALWLASRTPVVSRVATGLLLIIAPAVLIIGVDQTDISDFTNNANRELAKNGVFSFFAVLRAKQLDYGTFYMTTDERTALERARVLTGVEPEDFRSSVAEKDITFANVWGAADEDLYRWMIREADRVHAAGRPFYFFVMTTSNHRPYTYPENRIDIPSGSGRDGAVKYSDWAIGQLIREARTRPWFDNTIFIFVADHTASSAGKAELEIHRYHIPLIFYSPSHLQPADVPTLCSQIDVAPTLFALLGWSYDSLFFGRDILAMAPDEGRAWAGNYQKLGLFRDQQVVILKPDQNASSYRCDPWGRDLVPGPMNQGLLDDAVVTYQSAFVLFNRGLLGEANLTRLNSWESEEVLEHQP